MNEESKTIAYYDLARKESSQQKNETFWQSAKGFYRYISGDGLKIIFTLICILLNSLAMVATPYILSHIIDTYIVQGDLQGLRQSVLLLVGLYTVTFLFGYFQNVLIGQVAQSALFKIRNALFAKLQALPLAFFNQNQSGDLISRINGDTQKLGQFLSESVTRFAGGFFMLIGIGSFVFFLNWKMALVMLAVIPFLYIFTKILNPFAERTNKASLQAIGQYSAHIQEHISNFRAIIAYNKRKYFVRTLTEGSEEVYRTGTKATIINRAFEPVYDFAGYISLIIVTVVGIMFIGNGTMTIGALIAFIAYTQRFYDPLRTMATIFGATQVSLAAWGRIHSILKLDNGLPVISNSTDSAHDMHRLELKHVTFGYEVERPILEQVSFAFDAGKTYALVGPTGGGKSTLANLMARLFDPQIGTVVLDGKDIRTYTPEDRTAKISVILQEPLLFAGSVADNIRYGNPSLAKIDDAQLETLLVQKGFKEVIARFDQGLAMKVQDQGSAGLSLGQKQLISFMRAVLREPVLLILDEATANIDTVTEAILNKTLEVLPRHTTKVIIAHRLNTIEEADEILFVNGHHVTKAGNLDEAISLIEKSKRKS